MIPVISPDESWYSERCCNVSCEVGDSGYNFLATQSEWGKDSSVQILYLNPACFKILTNYHSNTSTKVSAVLECLDDTDCIEVTVGSKCFVLSSMQQQCNGQQVE
ncbi:hypothetical protein LOK49_LG07G00379 [Camellia lanceoleosa]|uniref:Uncharacterized protein n=1 Tax=Camellia lanceoleosa TaxID=1840588 RepID=A0ACC0H460_9ERIC|nr:hypothetical protein LOK49_LG07G00379 [Camellia lanceoleosa]